MAGEGALQYPGRWAVEATVEAIQDSMDLQSYARVEDIDDLTNDIEGLQDSVAYLLMGDEQSFWPDD